MKYQNSIPYLECRNSAIQEVYTIYLLTVTGPCDLDP